MMPCLSQALTMSAPFAADVAAFADAGCEAVELWLTKLETHVETAGLDDARRRLAERGLTPRAAAFQGGLLLSAGAERQAHLDHFQRRLNLCQALGVPVLILAPDRVERADAATLHQAVAALRQAAALAAAFGVRLALEFQAGSRWCASLETAVALLGECGEPNLGICLDLFHYYTGPSKFEDLELLNRENLAHVQLCDLAGMPRELARDADRILPGDGDFRLAPIIDLLRRIGYEGAVSVELLNPDLWQMNPIQVAEAAITGLRRLLGLARMQPSASG